MNKDGEGARLTDVLFGGGLALLGPDAEGPGHDLLLVRAVGLHHLTLLRGDDVLLLPGLLPGRGARDGVARGDAQRVPHGGERGGGTGGHGGRCRRTRGPGGKLVRSRTVTGKLNLRTLKQLHNIFAMVYFRRILAYLHPSKTQ